MSSISLILYKVQNILYTLHFIEYTMALRDLTHISTNPAFLHLFIIFLNTLYTLYFIKYTLHHIVYKQLINLSGNLP